LFDCPTERAATGFSQGNARNAAIGSQAIIAQNTLVHDPVLIPPTDCARSGIEETAQPEGGQNGKYHFYEGPESQARPQGEHQGG
jgi:hypothetical protein